MKRKQIIAAAFLAIFFFCMASCGKEDESESVEIKEKDTVVISEQAEENDESQTQTTNNQTSASEYEEARITYMGQYYEDRTWVICDYDWLLIDTEGNAIVKVSGLINTPSYFDCGYTHFSLYGKNIYYTMDKNGEIVNRFALDNGSEQMAAFGGGYIMTKEDISGFESVGCCYRVYNADGSLNGSFTLDSTSSHVNYLGRGVFSVGEGYYCAKSAVWIESVPYSYHNISSEFDGDRIILGYTYGSDDEGCAVLILSADGSIEAVFPEELSSWCLISALSNDYCVIYDKGYGRIFSFDVKTGTSYVLDEAYYEKLADDVKPEPPTDGRIVIPMEGADGKVYSAIFDTKFNLVAKAQLGNFVGASDGRFVAAVDVIYNEVYDVNGNFVFSITDMGYEPYFGNQRNKYFSCGALLIKEMGTSDDYQFIDTDGNPLFEKINFENVKILSIE